MNEIPIHQEDYLLNSRQHQNPDVRFNDVQPIRHQNSKIIEYLPISLDKSVDQSFEEVFEQFADDHLRSSFDRKFVKDFAKHFIELRQLENKQLYFITTCYKSSKSQILTEAAANKYLKRFHVHLLEHLAGSSHISTPSFRKIEPQMHSFMDKPHSKQKSDFHPTTRLSNAGLHHHSILIADRKHAAKLDQLCGPAASAAFVRSCVAPCQLLSLNVQKIGSTHFDVIKTTDYASYSARQRLQTYAGIDAYTVFPQSRSDFKR